MLPCVFEFLGSSQTFLGVLIALVVIMPYQGDGNPFYKILSTVRTDIATEIPNGFSIEALAELKQFYAYKIISERAREKDLLGKECMSFLVKIALRITRESLSFHKEEYVNKLGEIFKLKEMHLAPFYMFLFCLVIFIADEILRSVSSPEYLVGSLIWFTLLTVIFWFAIWTIYTCDVLKIFFTKVKSKSFLLTKRFIPEDKQLIFVILLLVVVLFVITVVGLYHLAVGSVGKILVFGVIGLMLLKGCLSFRFMFSHTGIGYRFVFKHFMCIVILSLFCAWMFKMVPDGSAHYPVWLVGQSISCPDFTSLKLTVFATVLVFGLILPFVLPLLYMIWVRKQASSNAASIAEKANTVIFNIQSELEEFVKKHKLE